MEIKRSSNLRSIIIMFLRHQHILIILIKIIIKVIEIEEFSTSKVDILYKLFRTFDRLIIFEILKFLVM